MGAAEQAGVPSVLRRQLLETGARAILGRLAEIGGGKSVCLLCWERDPTDPETPCHRRYLAEFLAREAGIVGPELKAGMLAKRPDAQPALFDYREERGT